MSLLSRFAARNDRKSDARDRSKTRRRFALEALEGRQLLATNITVTSLLDSAAPAADTTLREAILQANSTNDDVVIQFTSSLATSRAYSTRAQGSFELNSALPVIANASHTVTIQGLNDNNGAPRLTLDAVNRSGQNVGAPITVNQGAQAVLKNFKIINSSGRGVENNGTMTLNNVTLSNNQNGGAVNRGTMSVVNSRFTNNSAINYGGGVNNYFGTLSISGSTISGNSARYGGGVITAGGTVAISYSTITGNSASVLGGGLEAENNAVITLTHVDLYGNTNPASPGNADVYSTSALSGSDNVIGVGPVSGIRDLDANGNHVGTRSAPAKPQFVTQNTVNLTDGYTVTYRYVYDVRTNRGDLYLTSTAPRRISVQADYLNSDYGYNPIIGFSFTDNDNSFGSTLLTGGYDAGNSTALSPLGPVNLNVHVNSGYWTNGIAALNPTVTSDTGLVVDPTNPNTRWK